MREKEREERKRKEAEKLDALTHDRRENKTRKQKNLPSVLFAAQLGGVSLGHLLPNLEYFAKARDAGGRLLAVIRRAPKITVPSTPQRKRFSLFGGGGGGSGGSGSFGGGSGGGGSGRGTPTSSSHSSPSPMGRSDSAGSTPRRGAAAAAAAAATPTSSAASAAVVVALTPGEEAAAAAAEKKRRRLSRWAPPPKAAAALLRVKGRIEFRDVSFAYQARPETLALDRLDLEILPGKTTALCGSSGSGKSTALALMLRLYDPTAGSVCLDGVDLRQLDPRAFRAATALVPQEPTLFSCSVADNIRFGRPSATDEEVRAAAVAAGAAAFVDALPQGFATLVGERGGQLSGGQRQRIAIARAIVRDPKVLFLDEATAALDAASQRVVQDSLARLRGAGGGKSGSKAGGFSGLTTVIVAHRLSTIADSDRIVGEFSLCFFFFFWSGEKRFSRSSVDSRSLAGRKKKNTHFFSLPKISKKNSFQPVMANGRNVEQGTHSELLENEAGAYSALVRLQLEAGEGGGGEKSGEGKKSKSSGAAGGSSSSSSSPSASPGSSPAGVTPISAADESAASAAAASAAVSAAASASASAAARAAEGVAAATEPQPDDFPSSSAPTRPWKTIVAKVKATTATQPAWPQRCKLTFRRWPSTGVAGKQPEHLAAFGAEKQALPRP